MRRAPVGAGGEGDEDVEVEVAQFVGREAVVGAHGAEQLAGFEPVTFGGGEQGRLFSSLRRKRCSAGLVAPRHSSASTTEEVRSRPDKPSIFAACEPERR